MFNRGFVRKLRDEMLLEISAVAEKHGLKAECASARFDDTEATFSYRLAAGGEAGEQDAQAKFAKLAEQIGLRPDARGMTITQGVHVFLVERINPRARSCPVICRRMDGKLFKFPVSVVAKKL
jgi:hypothetical protein